MKSPPSVSSATLARFSLYLTSSQIIQSAVAFGANLVLVRFLLPADFGRFAIAYAGIALMFSIFSCNVSALIIRTSDDDFDDARQDRYYSILILESLLSLTIIVLWMIFTDEGSLWVYGLLCALAGRHWLQQNRAFYERHMPYRTLPVIEAGAAITAHIVSLIALFSGAGIASLFIREIILTLVEIAGLWAVGGITIRKFKIPSVQEWGLVLREASGIWLDGVLENAYQRLVILASGLLGGNTAAGFLFQAQRLAVIPNQLLSPVFSRLSANWMSRAETPEIRIGRRQKFLMLSFPILLVLGIATYFWADPVVPWIFGENWQHSADLLAAMCGMVTFLTLFEILKSYCAVTRCMRVLFVGRIMQYAGLAGAALAASAGWMASDVAIAVGQSAGFALAFVVVFLILRWRESSQRRTGSETEV
jgi:O-antigen/teichoic acid export membrane protein